MRRCLLNTRQQMILKIFKDATLHNLLTSRIQLFRKLLLVALLVSFGNKFYSKRIGKMPYSERHQHLDCEKNHVCKHDTLRAHLSPDEQETWYIMRSIPHAGPYRLSMSEYVLIRLNRTRSADLYGGHSNHQQQPCERSPEGKKSPLQAICFTTSVLMVFSLQQKDVLRLASQQ